MGGQLRSRRPGARSPRREPCAGWASPLIERVAALALFGLLLCAAIFSASAEAQAPADDGGVDVTLHETALFRLRRGEGPLTVEARAQRASTVLSELVESVKAEQIAVHSQGSRCSVRAGAITIVELTEEDAKLAGDASCEAHANFVASHVRTALTREQQRSRVANTVFSASLVVFFGLVTLYLLRKLFDFSGRARRFLVLNPQRVPALRLKRLEVLGPAAVRSVLLLLTSLANGLGMFGLAYSWLVLSLSLFVGTRPYVERLTGFVLTPLSALVARIASALPLFVVVLIAGALVAVIVRIAELFFASVARGETRLAWLEPELAQATSALVRAGLVIFAMVFAAPVITGDPNGSISRTGTIVLVALALASAPLLTSMVAGIALAFSRSLRVGDRVEYGGRAGHVREIGLFVLTLGDEQDGSTVRVPHALSLWHPTRIFSRGAP
jgi:hypothetical protein